jgi:hypothetical protein
VENFCSSAGSKPFELPTTIQLFPHSKFAYAKTFLRGASDFSRTRLLLTALAFGDLERRIEQLLGACGIAGGYFHLWGHSWEVEAYDLWNPLERILARLAEMSHSIDFTTNHQAFCTLVRRSS